MLNIKNPKAHELAIKVAAATGETLTEAVIVSLEERLSRVRPVKPAIDVEKVEALLAEMRKHLRPLDPGEDPTAFLYDPETGLPA